MEELSTRNSGQCCDGCLSLNDESLVKNYAVQNDTLKTMFRAENLKLCYICKRMAQHAEIFIQNVQSNQKLLEKFHNLSDSTFQTVRSQVQPLIELKHLSLDTIHLSGSPVDNVEDPLFVMYKSNHTKDVNIKLEMTEEVGYMPDHLEGEFDNDDGIIHLSESPADKTTKDVTIKLELKEENGYIPNHIEGEVVDDDDDDEFQGSLIKQEDEYPLKASLTEEVESDDVDLNCLKESLKEEKAKQQLDNDKDELKQRDIPKVKQIFITREQCMEERMKMLEDKKYLNSLYKCENCIKGFSFKASYEEHMEMHNEKMGDYECDICMQRMPTEQKLQGHKKRHQIRYECSECGLTRASRMTVKDHYTATHCFTYYHYNCPHCPKVFTRQDSLRKHICFAHTQKERLSCAYCPNTYANKESLKAHIIVLHQKDESISTSSKCYMCSECDKEFKTPSQLRIHRVKHSITRNFHCAECNKSFKSHTSLQHHLKTALPHVPYSELPLACVLCNERFAIKKDLDRHTSRVHLNIRPHQCDMCDKAYVNIKTLREHKKTVHEGYKRPHKYICTMCDKVFNRSQTLKSHIRTHTGERPYQCNKCPAQFRQAGALGTHMKLVHLNLTRKGIQKDSVVKSE